MWDSGTPEKVDSVEDELRHLGRKRCQWGGHFIVGTQSHEWDEKRGRHFLVDHAQCTQCGRAKKFAFDVSGYFSVDSG